MQNDSHTSITERPLTHQVEPTQSALITDHLTHLRVERRLAKRTLTLYADAFARMGTLMASDGLATGVDSGHMQAADLTAVKPHHVRGWVARLHAQGLGANSIAIHLAAWRGLFRWLGRHGRVALNPVDGVRAPKAGKPLPKALSVDQAVALTQASVPASSALTRTEREAPWLQARDRCMVELLYGSGLRNAELLGLDVQAGPDALGWIDMHAGEAHVLGKGHKRRMVPVGQQALAALRTWLEVREQLTPHTSDSALFIGRLGQRLTADQLRHRLKQLALSAGLPTHVHPHMLRHSFASHVLQSSQDLRGVQELLGHAHITTTQVYTRLDFQHLAKVYDQAHPRAKRKPGNEGSNGGQ